MHYNVHDFPIELQDISYRIYTSNFSYLLVFFSWHMHNVFGSADLCSSHIVRFPYNCSHDNAKFICMIVNCA